VSDEEEVGEVVESSSIDLSLSLSRSESDSTLLMSSSLSLSLGEGDRRFLVDCLDWPTGAEMSRSLGSRPLQP
jgi:hypothetical protein